MNGNDVRICFVSDTLHTYFEAGTKKGVGGAERQQYLIGQKLRESGAQVSVVTLDIGGDSPEEIDGVEVWKEIPDRRGVTGAPIKTVAVLNALRKVNADVYYVRGNDFLCVLTALYCQLANETFLYAVANDSDIEPQYLKDWNRIRSKLYRTAVASADAVSVLTPHQQDVLRREHGVESTVIPCGYDLPPAETLLDHGDREHILWVGRLDPDQKKPERYLELANTHPQLSFVMIGPPDNDDEGRTYFRSIQQRAEEIENLEFIEFVPPGEIYKYFRTASMLVNTSDYEGFGNVFLEAWRYETPVLTLNYTLHGVISDRNVGVHAGTMDTLSEAVDQLSNDVERRAEMGRAGRKLVQEKYSIDTVVDQYSELIRTALQE